MSSLNKAAAKEILDITIGWLGGEAFLSDKNNTNIMTDISKISYIYKGKIKVVVTIKSLGIYHIAVGDIAGTVTSLKFKDDVMGYLLADEIAHLVRQFED